MTMQPMHVSPDDLEALAAALGGTVEIDTAANTAHFVSSNGVEYIAPLVPLDEVPC